MKKKWRRSYGLFNLWFHSSDKHLAWLHIAPKVHLECKSGLYGSKVYSLYTFWVTHIPEKLDQPILNFYYITKKCILKTNKQTKIEILEHSGASKIAFGDV